MRTNSEYLHEIAGEPVESKLTNNQLLQKIANNGVPSDGGSFNNKHLEDHYQLVNVYDFGARGDGTTDDSDAIQAASIKARDTNKILLIPPNTYRINKTVVMQCNVMATGATFTVNDRTLTAIQYGSNFTYLKNLNATLPSVIQLDKAPTGWGEGDVGIRIVNIGESIINIQRVTHFSTGVWLTTEGSNGNVYNTYTFEWLGNNKVNLLLLQTDDYGWVNQNTFIGGRFSHSSAGEGDEIPGCRQIAMLCRETTETTVPDNNQFYGVSLEGNAPEYHIECVGNHNLFSNCRFETTSPILPKIYWRAIAGRVAYSNKIIGGSFSDDIVYTKDEGVHSNSRWGSRKMVLDGKGGAGGELVVRNSTAPDRAAISVLDHDVDPEMPNLSPHYSVHILPRYYRGKRKEDSAPRVQIDNHGARISFGNGVDQVDNYFERWGAGVLRFSGSTLARNYRTTDDGGVVNDLSGFNSFVNTSDTGTIISRNRSDDSAVLTIDNRHENSTGDIISARHDGDEKFKIDVNGVADASGYSVNGEGGASGTFVSSDGKTVTVIGGIITGID